jgi:hypothetical protein
VLTTPREAAFELNFRRDVFATSTDVIVFASGKEEASTSTVAGGRIEQSAISIRGGDLLAGALG